MSKKNLTKLPFNQKKVDLKVDTDEPAKIQKVPSSISITTENIFLIQTHNRIFHSKADCLLYLKNKSNIHLFCEDKSVNFNKRYFALDYDTIYDLSKLKKFFLYECFEKDERVKLSLDIDLKKEHITKNLNRNELFDSIIYQSIDLVN
jgi:hypothetical protein